MMLLEVLGASARAGAVPDRSADVSGDVGAAQRTANVAGGEGDAMHSGLDTRGRVGGGRGTGAWKIRRTF